MENEIRDKSFASMIVAQLISENGDRVGNSLQLPLEMTTKRLEELLNELFRQQIPRQEDYEYAPYSFYINDLEIIDSIDSTLKSLNHSPEVQINIVYRPQAIFKVRSVTRCCSSMAGHGEAILSVAFSPDGTKLASGSGDKTVRLWDILTETPHHTLDKVHTGWVQCISWSPDGQWLISGGMDNLVQIWDPRTGGAIGAPLKGHTKWITSLAWEPLHQNIECTRFATGSKDGTVKVWDRSSRTCLFTLTQHTDSVTCIKWGGEGLIYTASRDRTIKVWDAQNGKLCRSLEGHGHWVNTIALNTDFALRTGAFDLMDRAISSSKEMALQISQKKYLALKGSRPERLVSGSDDYTLMLWEPAVSKKPISRMTGHQQLINHVCFSPDGRIIASASFDKSIRLWDGFTGRYMVTLRGHVASVYQVSWSADSRILISGSKDSTIKVWSPRTGKLDYDLPGHADEVYSVDWSPDGDRVASGGKDRLLKM